jgi:hypothetical protein
MIMVRGTAIGYKDLARKGFVFAEQALLFRETSAFAKAA